MNALRCYNFLSWKSVKRFANFSFLTLNISDYVSTVTFTVKVPLKDTHSLEKDGWNQLKSLHLSLKIRPAH